VINSREPVHGELSLELAAAIVRAAEQAQVGISVSMSDASGRVNRQQNRQFRAATVGVHAFSAAVRLGNAQATVDFVVGGVEPPLWPAALHSSEEQFRRLLETTPDAVLIWTREGIVYANPALTELLGCDQSEFVTRRPGVEVVHPHDRALVTERFRTLLSDGAPTAATEFRLRGRDGTWVQLEVIAMVAEWNGARALMAVGRELSARRQQQVELVKEDQLTSVSKLAAGVAHEINNPLAYLLLNLQYLMRELPRFDGDAHTFQKLMSRVHEARQGAERVSGIVRELCDLSRRQEDACVPVDVRRVVAAALRLARPQIDLHADVVEQYGEVPTVLGDANRLEQVILSLLVNAAQALPQAEGARGQIGVRVYADDPGRVTVEVSDTGPGIHPSLLDRVFDPFYTTRSRGAGVGLSLPTCHRTVASLGGDIKVESQLGRGTSFRVSLPTVARAAVLDPVGASVAG
jgi:PAS domain S-box-containing protein